MYLKPNQAGEPVRLVGWQSVRAAPGQSVAVEVHTDPHLWRRWDTAMNAWSKLPGGGQLLVARGLGDIRATIDLDPGGAP